MGYNSRIENIILFLSAMEEALKNFGYLQK